VKAVSAMAAREVAARRLIILIMGLLT